MLISVLFFRAVESPRGLAARLARLTRRPGLKSVVYSESQFLPLDPENTEHRTWRHPYDPSVVSSDSFQELRDRARRHAVRLIEAAFRYLRYGEGTEESLSALIGNVSYLSGLPVDDPRNLRVQSLLPSRNEVAR